MSYFRQIHTSIWKDSDFLELTASEKLLFIYFFSNESTTLSGVYEISLRVVSFETKLSLSVIRKYLEKFEQLEKIYYRDGWVFVVNFQKYNRGGDTVKTAIRNEVDNIPDSEIKKIYMGYYHPNIPYTYPIISRVEESRVENSREEGKNPAAAPLDNLSELEVWIGVTGMTAYPSKARDEAPYLIRSLVSQHKDKTIEHCKPYYQEWLKRNYSKTNHGWLDWALAGQIPSRKNGNGKFTNYDKPTATPEEIQKALKGE